MSTPTAYPLQWPHGWPKTELAKKENGKFKQSLAGALGNLKTECARLGGKNLVLSSNYTLGSERPSESGVVAYFQLDGDSVSIPCDRWKYVEHNVQAIALTIGAMRGMERWGAKHMIKAMFSGFKALPPSSQKAWWEVLGCSASTETQIVRERYKSEARINHPDNGGSTDKMQSVNAAWEEFKKERGL